jgi:hypothetical protein
MLGTMVDRALRFMVRVLLRAVGLRSTMLRRRGTSVFRMMDIALLVVRSLLIARLAVMLVGKSRSGQQQA